MESELNNEKMITVERQEYINAMVTSLKQKSDNVEDILGNTKTNKTRLDQENNRLSAA